MDAAVPAGGRRLPAGTAPFLLALPALGATLVLPWQAGWICAVAVIVVLGVPHGALDVEIARNLLRPRLGRAWFPVFALPYLALVAAVVAAWHIAPGSTLAAFLAASAWHFGVEDAGAFGLAAVARGGLPIAVPVLLQPGATAHILSAASGLPMDAPPDWLVACAVAWLVPAAVWASQARGRALVLPAVACAAFAALPALTAFALYFVAIHAPAHTAALIRHPTRAPRLRSAADAWRLAAPTTVLTILIGAALWPFYPGAPPVRLLCLTLQLLAAFTLPHMLLDAWLDRRDQAVTAPATRRSAATVRSSARPVTVPGAQWRWNARNVTSNGIPGS